MNDTEKTARMCSFSIRIRRKTYFAGPQSKDFEIGEKIQFFFCLFFFCHFLVNSELLQLNQTSKNFIYIRIKVKLPLN